MSTSKESEITKDDIQNDIDDIVSTSEAMDKIIIDINSTMKHLTNSFGKIKTLRREVATIERNLGKFIAARERRRAVSLKNHGSQSHKGFTTANNLISDEVSDLIGHPRGRPISRSVFNKMMNAYIRSHNLQNPDNRCIVMLEKNEGGKRLKDLLDPVVDENGNTVDLTLITVSKYIKKHFIGKTKFSPPTDVTNGLPETKQQTEEKTPSTDVKPVVTDAKPVVTDVKPVVTDAKPVVTDAKPKEKTKGKVIKKKITKRAVA